MKPNTIREYATIDLIYEIPFWLKQATRKLPPAQTVADRITTLGETRITVNGNIRIVSLVQSLPVRITRDGDIRIIDTGDKRGVVA